MIGPEKILRQSLVKPFYTENAGAFVLVFTMMFVIVGSTHGYGLYAYHHSLAVGMLSNPGFLSGVFFLWFLYARKYISYIATTMRRPMFGFLDILNRLSKTRLFFLFIMVEIWLLLPIILYAAFVIAIGIEGKYYLSAILIILYLIIICLAAAAWHVYHADSLYKDIVFPWQKIKRPPAIASAYTLIILRFIATAQKATLLGIKIFTCGILYLTARNNSQTDYDISLPFLFFNFGILANGILIYSIKEFEKTHLSFFRGLPISLPKRLSQYLFVFVILLVPEYLTLAVLMPIHLHYTDAFNFSLCAFGLLLLINTIASLQYFGRKEFAAILLLLFGVQYVFMLAAGLTALYLFFLGLGVALFLWGYYKYDGIHTE